MMKLTKIKLKNLNIKINKEHIFWLFYRLHFKFKYK
jgi:hypothetical protein